MTVVSSTIRHLWPFCRIRCPCLHHSCDRIARAPLPTKMNPAFTPMDLETGAPLKTLIRTRLPLVAVCNPVFAPRLPNRAPPCLPTKLHVRRIVLTAPSPCIEGSCSASTPHLALQTGAFAAQNLEIRRSRRQLFCLFAPRRLCRVAVQHIASRRAQTDN